MKIYILQDGEQLGPFPLEHVWVQLESGDLSAADASARSFNIESLTSLRSVMPRLGRTLPSDEIWQKEKPAEKIRPALRVTSGLVERHLVANRLIAGTMLLLIASWVYPPWILNGRSHGWFLLFDTTQSLVMQIDFGRLLLIDAIIGAAGGLLVWATFHKWTSFQVAAHLTVCSVLIASVVAVVSLVAILFERDAIGALPIGGQSSQTSEDGGFAEGGDNAGGAV